MNTTLKFKKIEDSNYSISNRGDVINRNTARILKWRKMKGNRYRVNLYYNGKRNPKYIHILLNEYFKSNEIDVHFEKIIITKIKLKKQ